jgi:hypothetical protein
MEEEKTYSIKEIIFALENKLYDIFDIGSFGAFAVTNDYCEIVIRTENDEIPEKNRQLALLALKNLKQHVERANNWLGHFNLKHDKWYPNALDGGYKIVQIYAGEFEAGGYYRHSGFYIKFDTVNNYPCEFIVKFNTNSGGWPYAVEECVE